MAGAVFGQGSEVISLPAGQPGGRYADGGLQGIAKGDIGIPGTGGCATVVISIEKGDAGRVISIVGEDNFEICGCGVQISHRLGTQHRGGNIGGCSEGLNIRPGSGCERRGFVGVSIRQNGGYSPLMSQIPFHFFNFCGVD